MSDAKVNQDQPTIVLVHGAFADGSSWDGVIERLQREGYTVAAPAIGLRGVGVDSEYLASVLTQIEGPVLLVGHSYGGAVITNAASGMTNVVGLVFVAAFAPNLDEALGDVTGDSKDAILGAALVQHEYPTDGETAIEFVIDPAKFRETFAADLPPERAAIMASTQRPIAAVAFGDRSGPPAWKSLPSWAVVATGDKAAGADLVRSMARRAGAEITEVESSHVVMVSQPQAVTDVIMEAAKAIATTGGRSI
jgi:pimeloyl-ACP methyl ester carboxylesterase